MLLEPSVGARECLHCLEGERWVRCIDFEWEVCQIMALRRHMGDAEVKGIRVVMGESSMRSTGTGVTSTNREGTPCRKRTCKGIKQLKQPEVCATHRLRTVAGASKE